MVSNIYSVRNRSTELYLKRRQLTDIRGEPSSTGIKKYLIAYVQQLAGVNKTNRSICKPVALCENASITFLRDNDNFFYPASDKQKYHLLHPLGNHLLNPLLVE